MNVNHPFRRNKPEGSLTVNGQRVNLEIVRSVVQRYPRIVEHEVVPGERRIQVNIVESTPIDTAAFATDVAVALAAAGITGVGVSVLPVEAIGR